MSLTGDLQETPLTDLLEFFCRRGETVSLAVHPRSGGEGVFFIEKGALVHGRLDELVGIQALRKALRISAGDYRVERGELCQQRTIFEPWNAIVLEAARQNDEADA